MTALQNCPTCGCDLPADFPPGLCPDCLFAAGLESAEQPQPVSPSQPASTVTPLTGGFVPPPPDSLTKHFPQLEILAVLGQGGMGAVYQARQTKLDRLVALKIIRPESADDPAFAERFNREARMLARLNHPNIVAVYDFGEITLSTPDAHGETPRTLYYFVMEYVDGANLRQLIAGGTLSSEQSLAIIPQVCDALQYAHDEGIVHRDVKPENILIDRRGRVKIADFGLAKLAARSEHDFTLTGTHQVMGTPRYMAPEQMEGSHAVDHRADIYSLGVVFYEMLTGHLPMGRFDPPSKQSAVDVRVDEVILRALAREPDRRYQHAAEIGGQVNAIRGIYSSEALQSIQQLGNVWPGASTMFDVAVGKVVGGVRQGTVGRFLTAPAVPGVLTGVLSAFGALSTFVEWGYIEGADGQWRHVYGYDEVAGIFIGILFLAYAAVMFISTTSDKRPVWRPWTNFLTAAGVFFGAFVFANDAFHQSLDYATEIFFVPIGLAVVLVVVGTWDLRCWLHQPRKRQTWNPLSQAVSVASSSSSGTLTAGTPRKTGRDWVTLSREQVENDLLPDICMVCGAPTEGRVNKTFSFAKMFKIKEMRVACPICPRHRGHWRKLVLMASTGWLLMFVFSGIGTLAGMAMYPRHGGPWAAGAGIGFFVGLGVYVGSIIYLACTRVTVEWITDEEIKFRRVSAAFANAVGGTSIGTSATSAPKPSEAAPVAEPAQEVLSAERYTLPPPTWKLDERRIEMQVKAPAVGLWVTAIAGLAFWGIVGGAIIHDTVQHLQWRRAPTNSEITLFIVVSVPVLAVASVTIIGANKMRRLQGYEWSTAAAFLALIPWTGIAYPLAVVIGVWALRTLRREDVKDAFLARSLQDD